MKICIDARSPGYAGILTYARCLLQGIAKVDALNQYIILRAPGDSPWNIPGMREIEIPSKNPVHWFLWSNTSLPNILKREVVSVYHSLKHITCFRGPFKKIVTFHSARFLIHPQHYKWYDYAYWRVMCPFAAKTYDAVITVSDAERKHYSGGLNIPSSRFESIHLACNETFLREINSKERDEVRKKYNLPDHFILYVGRINPVKNLETLIRAYALAVHKDGIKHTLVLVGKKSWHTKAVENVVKECRVDNRVLFTGPIFDELAVVYSLSDLFVFPSYYEAFPAVPLEAMACGAPVVCARVGGLPEVVGDAAVTIPPKDIEGFREAIVAIVRSPERQAELRAKGLQRVQHFSWKRTAERTVAFYEEIASRRVAA